MTAAPSQPAIAPTMGKCAKRYDFAGIAARDAHVYRQHCRDYHAARSARRIWCFCAGLLKRGGGEREHNRARIVRLSAELTMIAGTISLVMMLLALAACDPQRNPLEPPAPRPDDPLQPRSACAGGIGSA